MKLVATKFDSMYGRTYCTEYELQTEKTLRDEFAMTAMTGFIIQGQGSIEEIAEAAYITANAMLKAREK